VLTAEFEEPVAIVALRFRWIVEFDAWIALGTATLAMPVLVAHAVVAEYADVALSRLVELAPPESVNVLMPTVEAAPVV
jgi:hypothetical protein